MKIRQKLTVLLLFIGLIPTLVASGFAYVTISAQLTAKTEDQLTSLAIKQSQKIDTLLQGRQEQLLKLANRYDLQSAISEYAAGNFKDTQSIITVLRERKTELTDVRGIYLTNKADQVIASTISGAQGKLTLSREYVAKDGQQNYITVHDDPQDGIQKLYIATKMTVNQKDIGFLTLVFSLDDIISTLQDYTGLGATGETVVAVRGDKGSAVSLFPLRFDPDSSNKSLDSLRLPDTERTYTNIQDYRQHAVIIAAQPIASVDWILATKIDTDEAFAPIVQLRNTMLAIFIASSVAIVVIALMFTRFFTAPIIALTAKTRDIMLGDFTQRIVVNSSDEVGTLANAFNRMTDELDKSYQALEKKVAERTKALNQNVQELSDAKAKDEAILSSLGEGMIVSDSNGRVLLINGLAGELLGVDAGNAIGKPFTPSLLDASDDKPIPAAEHPMAETLRTGEKTIRQVKSVHADGQKLALGITATPVLQHGKVIGSVQIIRDITREKEIDRMKTEFISLASHQLRTPLSAIRWFSEMLVTGDAGKLKPEQQEFAQNVYDSTERMIALVSSLLNISRIESGRIRIDPKPTVVHELVNGIVNDLKAKTEERRQNIIVSVHNDLPKVNLDARLIGQVYMNLLTNAIKYSPKGGEISVFVSRKDDELVTQITDNGYGIPKSEQDKMFQKFFRATNVAKVETDGTGLGMYLVKAIIESSGGRIWFESEEGKGTTFWFSLPIAGMTPKEGEVTIE